MKRNTVMIFVLIGVVAVVCLVAAAFVVLNMSHRMGGMYGPGMMNGYDAQRTPGGLVAEAPEATPLPKAVESTPAAQAPSQPESAPAAQATALPENTAMEKAGNLTVLLAISPYPPVRSKASGFDVTLLDENGQAVSDASVSLDLTMPSMYMPPNKFAAKYTENGVYHGSGRFTMGGLWRIEVIVQRGSEKVSAFFNIDL